MPKRKSYMTVFGVLAVASILLASYYTLPSGASADILAAPKDGAELLVNPSLENNCSGWGFGSWRFLSQSWHPSEFVFEEGKVTMTLRGDDRSFYCVNIGQQPNVDIHDRTHKYHATWRGTVHHAEAKPTGALGVGVNLWLDVIKDGETQDVLELLVFFHQQGFYTIPVGSYKDYGYRGTYWFERLSDAPTREPDTWRFYYFHPTQLEFGKPAEVTFSLNKVLQVVREHAGETYRDADYFRLTEVTSVMEMIMAEGSFTTEHLSIRLVE